MRDRNYGGRMILMIILVIVIRIGRGQWNKIFVIAGSSCNGDRAYTKRF